MPSHPCSPHGHGKNELEPQMEKMILRILLAFMIGLASSAPGHAADRLTVLLEWFVNPDHAPLVVAKELGFFEQAGLEIELVPPADPSIVPRAVASGQAEIGIHYQPNLYLDHAAGVPLVRIGTLVETPLNTLTVLADGPVKSIADLAGRRIGFSVSGFEDAMLGRMLERAGVDPAGVELINVNFALSASLLAGRVDATIGGFRNFELTQMRLEGREGRAFFPEEHGVPVYDELIFVTRPDLVEDDRLKRFLDVVERGAIHLTNHPEQGWELFIRAYPDLDDALNRQAWIDTLPRFAKRPAALDRGRYERFGAFLAEAGLIQAAPEVDAIAVELSR
jgi:putative hydroxymethylpyrimidine transport system substrate-binding protein